MIIFSGNNFSKKHYKCAIKCNILKDFECSRLLKSETLQFPRSPTLRLEYVTAPWHGMLHRQWTSSLPPCPENLYAGKIHLKGWNILVLVANTRSLRQWLTPSWLQRVFEFNTVPLSRLIQVLYLLISSSHLRSLY